MKKQIKSVSFICVFLVSLLTFIHPDKAYSGRVTDSQLVLYTFDEGSGSIVHDVSGAGAPLDIRVNDETAIGWITGGLAVNASTLITTSVAAVKIIDACRVTDEITLEAWVKPANTTQSGPARIVTLSQNPYNRNFTLGQKQDQCEIRLRTTTTSNNGRPALSTPTGLLDTGLSHVVYTHDSSGLTQIYMDGVLRASEIIGGDFSNWNETYRLALANELTNDRPWLGELYLVAIYNSALSQAEVEQNFLAGSEGVGNQSPTASFTATPTSGVAPVTVNFDATASHDPDGTIVSYNWDFGDGGADAGIVATHEYSAIGTYQVILTVADNEGATDNKSAYITVYAAPVPPNIVTHPADRTVTVGQSATFSVEATGTPPLAYQWQKNIVDISGATGDSYTTEATTLQDDGAAFLCIVTNVAGSAISNEATLIVVEAGGRVTDGQLVLYTFGEGSGSIVHDVSGVGTPLDLRVNDETAISWTNGGLAVNQPTFITTSVAATKIIDACRVTNEITLEAWVKPANTTQSGPARIVTLSQNPYNRNFTLGQKQDQCEVRLRTTATSANGIPALSTQTGLLDTGLSHVVYTHDSSGFTQIYIDGILRASEIIGGDFSGWNETYRLALANELTNDRPWLGELYLVAIYNRALSQAEAEQNFQAKPNAGPAIINPQATAGDTYCTITWTTNVPATGSVAYGQSTAYEEGSITDNSLVTAHSITLTDLIPDTMYHYRITSLDEAGYGSSSTDLIFATIFAAPNIDVWYGGYQSFGHIGIPQRWVNILGNVNDPDGVASLSCSLNGGQDMPLSIGPDGYRLASNGDFNAEIVYTDLIEGANQLTITAVDNLGNQSVSPVTIDFTGGNIWPLPYSIDWSAVSSVQEAAQIVDGLWEIQGDSVYPVIPGYDRILAIGDIIWENYEVTVPITVNSPPPYSSWPGVGILIRWDGHHNWGGEQPNVGWYPMGALGWYRWNANGGQLELLRGGGDLVDKDDTRTLELNVRYIFKMRAQIISSTESLFSLKVWEDGTVEPAAWDLVGSVAEPKVLQFGSFLLMAHNVVAEFGEVTVQPLAEICPIISNIQTVTGDTWCTVTWDTDIPATSIVDYGQSQAYEDGSVIDESLITSHSITLTNLTPDTLYHYRITSVDNDGFWDNSDDLTFITDISGGIDPSIIISDDFSSSELNTNLWTLADPLGDATLTMTGSELSISIPGGVSHDVWRYGNYAPRIMQQANDTDFEIEVKFDSEISSQYQLQGIIIEEDDNNFLRFDFYSTGSSTKIFAAAFTNGAPSVKANNAILESAHYYMRVRREGNQWTQSYSADGVNWTMNVGFNHVLAVSSAGVFAGNAGSNPPAHTALIDYFFNTASPIVPGD